jgi:hypothetical protein
MATWILAHGSGVDDLLGFAAASVLVVAVRHVLRRRGGAEDAEDEDRGRVSR